MKAYATMSNCEIWASKGSNDIQLPDSTNKYHKGVLQVKRYQTHMREVVLEHVVDDMKSKILGQKVRKVNRASQGLRTKKEVIRQKDKWNRGGG